MSDERLAVEPLRQYAPVPLIILFGTFFKNFRKKHQYETIDQTGAFYPVYFSGAYKLLHKKEKPERAQRAYASGKHTAWTEQGILLKA
jgi:hypothetical protein